MEKITKMRINRKDIDGLRIAVELLDFLQDYTDKPDVKKHFEVSVLNLERIIEDYEVYDGSNFCPPWLIFDKDIYTEEIKD